MSRSEQLAFCARVALGLHPDFRVDYRPDRRWVAVSARQQEEYLPPDLFGLACPSSAIEGVSLDEWQTAVILAAVNRDLENSPDPEARDVVELLRGADALAGCS